MFPSGTDCFFREVYDSPHEESISGLWDDLRIIATSAPSVWLVVGYFNDIATALGKKEELTFLIAGVENLWRVLMLVTLLIWDDMTLNIHGKVLFSMVIIRYLKI